MALSDTLAEKITIKLLTGHDAGTKWKKGKTALDYCDEKDLPERAALIRRLTGK